MSPHAGRVSDYQTFAIDLPSDCQIKAACRDVDCQAWARGWESAIDESTDLGAAQAVYIRRHSGRTFRESRTAEGMTVFQFDSGQRCFTEHFTRPEVYTTRRGDQRANLGVMRRYASATDWANDFAEHELRRAEAIERG